MSCYISAYSNTFSAQCKKLLATSVFSLLPTELILEIALHNIRWALGVLNTHVRPYMRCNLRQKIQFIDNMISFAGKAGLGFEMNNYVLFHRNRLRILNLCSCCTRHTRGRPRILSPWIEASYTSHTEIRSCTCSCRHNSRNLCRGCVSEYH